MRYAPTARACARDRASNFHENTVPLVRSAGVCGHKPIHSHALDRCTMQQDRGSSERGLERECARMCKQALTLSGSSP
jgi:hypothetical protein